MGTPQTINSKPPLPPRTAPIGDRSVLDEKLLRCLSARKGEANAMRMALICNWLFEDEYRYAGQKARHSFERAVQTSVARQIRAGAKIGCNCSEKPGRPAGFYMIATAAELGHSCGQLIRRAVSILKRVEALTGKGMFTSELEGQRRLFETAALTQSGIEGLKEWKNKR